jgi:signal transduction histidine kinase
MLIRDKIIWIFTAIVVCILSLFSIYVFYFYSLYREQNFNLRLVNKAKVFGNVLIARNKLNDELFKNIVRNDLVTIVEEEIVVMNTNKKILYSNQAQTDTVFYKSLIAPMLTKKTFRFTEGKNEGAGHIYKNGDGKTYYIFVSGYDSLGEEKFGVLKWILAIGNLIALFITVVSAYFFSGRLLRPIKNMVLDVNSISESNLGKKLDEGNSKDEFAMLSITFNSMLTRLSKAFETQKSFIAHSSHQLRTPLANVLGTLQTSITYDKNLPEMKTSMESAVEELKHLIELSNNLLNLSKAENPAVNFRDEDLDLVLFQAHEQAVKKYPGRTITCNIDQSEDTDDSYLFSCNKTLLETALFNLIDNAVKYSDDKVVVSLAKLDKKYSIKILDSGEGIPPSELTEIFNPMHRGTNVKNVPGFGIGLALTDKIVALHNGKVSIKNKQTEQGIEAEVLLPLQAH